MKNTMYGEGGAMPLPKLPAPTALFLVILLILQTLTTQSQSLPLEQGLNSSSITPWSSSIISNGNRSTPALTYVTSSADPDGLSAQEGSGFFRFNSYDCSEGAQIRLRSPAINATALTGLEVKFQWAVDQAYPSSNDRVQVQYSLNGTTWTNAGSAISRAGSGSAQWTAQQVSIAAAAGKSSVYIGFLFISAWGNNCHIDNISIEAAANCAAPLNTTVTNMTINSGLLKWSAPATTSPTGYNWEVRSSGAGGSGSSGLITSGTVGADIREAAISSLQANTTYYAYIRSACGSEGNSNWAGPVNFATITSAPWSEGFEGLTTLGANGFPTGWIKSNNGINGGGWATYNSNSASYVSLARSGSNALNNRFGSPGAIWTTGIFLTAGTAYNFSFWFVGKDATNTGWNASVLVNTSQTASGATTLGPAFMSGGTAALSNYAQVVRRFTPSVSGVYYFAINLSVASVESANGLTFDDFELKAAPTCAQPELSVATTVGPVSAQLNWGTPHAGSVAYDWEVRSQNAPGSGATGLTAAATTNTGDNAASVASLTPTTVYATYARSNCGADGYSVWSGPMPLRTTTPLAVGIIETEPRLGYAKIGSGNNIVMDIKIPVTGSAVNNSLTLNSIVFTAKNTRDADVAVNGAKLWLGTSGSLGTQQATVSIVNGQASFTGLNINLPAGNNYLRLTYDVSTSAIEYNKLDATLAAGNISITASGGANAGGTLPFASFDPDGETIIKELVYCLPVATTAGGDEINRVRLSSTASGQSVIDKSSTSTLAYEDFYTTSYPVMRDTSYNFTINFNRSNTGDNLFIWIDYNRDGVFTSNEQVYNRNNVNSSSQSGSFIIPSTAAYGKTTMRILFANGVNNSCPRFGWGQMEDYQLVISSPPCTAPTELPTNLTFTATAHSLSGSFTTSPDADSYLVIRTSSPFLPQNPVNGTVYTAGTEALDGYVVYSGSNTSFVSDGLAANSTYWFWVYPMNSIGCSGGPHYLGGYQVLSGVATTGSNCITALLGQNNDEVPLYGFAGTGAQDLFVPNTCRSLARIAPCEDLLLNAATMKAQLWLDNEVRYYNDKPYVPRRYELTPEFGGYTCPSTITLYYSQADFDRFNEEIGPDNLFIRLPTDANDNFGKSNLRIFQFHGQSGEETGLPESYPSDVETSSINPPDNQIIWNSTLQRWEITFTIAGYSTFIVGSNGLNVLPVKQIVLSGKINNGFTQLQWQTIGEENVAYFTVERSLDGSQFAPVAKKTANGKGNHAYQFQDAAVASILYYRIVSVDKDGQTSYSQVLKLEGSAPTQYHLVPVPAKDYVILQTSESQTASITATITDLQGRVVKRISINQPNQKIDISQLASGIYFLQLSNHTTLRLVKQ